MDRSTKQRLVGVMVLVSLGIIFLPSLFQRESDERVVVNTQSLIPPKPEMKTIVVSPPEKTSQVAAPSPDEAFQPVIDTTPTSVASPEVKDTKKVTVSTDKPATALSLNENDLPTSWVIQVGSFQSQAHADALDKKLLDKNYKSYIRPIKTAKGEFFRVFVGPYIDRSRAVEAKALIDKQYRLTSQILRFSAK